MDDPAAPSAGDRRYFPLTRWSLMQRAREGSDTVRRSALDELARAYWWPLYTFLSRSGAGDERARDLVQGFFLSLLEKDLMREFDPKRGRFRTFLLACLKGYWGDERDRERALKRGGGKTPLPLDAPQGRAALDVTAPELTPEQAYERAWAVAKMDWAVAEVRRELHDKGETKSAAVLDAYVHADNPVRPGTAEIAAQVGLEEKAVRYLLEYLRRRLRKTLYDQLVEEAGDASGAEEELRWLYDRVGLRG